MNKKLKQVLSIFLCFCMVFGSVAVSGENIGEFLNSLSFKVFAEDTADTVTYSYDSTSNTLTVSGSGAMPNYSSATDQPWNSYAATAVKVVVTGVTSIGNNAFNGFTNCTTFQIDDTVTSIGNSAFKECRALTSMVISDNVTSLGRDAFFNCRALKSIVFGKGITSIQYACCYNCYALTTIEFKGALTYIAGEAFEFCNALTNVVIPYTVKKIDQCAFKKSATSTNTDPVYVYSNLETVGSAAFQMSYVTVYGTEAAWQQVSGYSGTNAKSITYTGSCGDFNSNSSWIFDGTKFIVSGTGATADYENNTDRAYNSIASSVKEIHIADGITTLGKRIFDSFTNCTVYDIPSTVTEYKALVFGSNKAMTSFTMNDNVTAMGSQCFGTCSALTSFTFSKNITAIPDQCFEACSSFTAFTVPNTITTIGTKAFQKCSKLASVSLPASLTSIGNYAFLNCTALTSVTVPANVTNLACGAFEGCTTLNSVTFAGNKLTEINHSVFKDCKALASVTIPDNVTKIYENIFLNCTALTSVSLPDSLTAIGHDAFKNCTKLESVTIPADVSEIGTTVFYLCSALKTVTFKGDKVTRICGGTFNSCTALETVDLPKTITQIDANAFNGCTALTSLTIPYSVTSLGENSLKSVSSVTFIGGEEYWNDVTGFSTCGVGTKIFTGGCKIGDSAYLHFLDSENGIICGSGDIYSYEDYTQSPWYSSYSTVLKSVSFSEDFPENIPNNMFKGFTSLSSVTFSDGVKSIGNNAFDGCTALAAVTFNDSIEAIGKYAFSNCTSLNSVTFGTGIKAVDDYTFYKCSALTEITIPSDIESLGKYCFYNCLELTTVNLSVGIKTIDDYCFAKCYKLSGIKLPTGLETIGARAFLDCYALESLEIPYTVTSIGKCAFISSGLKTCTIYNPDITISSDCFVNIDDDADIYCPENSTTETALNKINISVPEGRGSLTYTLNSDGESYSVSGVSNGNCSYVVIPSTYNGKPVNGIKDNTFKDETSINNIYLPSGTLNSVGKNVIKNTGYYNLHEDGDLTIGDICFGLKGSVSSVTIPEGVRIIPDFAFAGKACITSLSLPNSVETIGNYAFYGCGNMDLAENTLYLKRFKESVDYQATYLILGWNSDYHYGESQNYIDSCNFIYKSTAGENVKKIGEKAFYGCSSLTAIKIATTDAVIGSKAFEKCDNLYINIDYKNPVVKTLYDNHIKALISDDSFEYIFKEDFSGLVLTYQREEVVDFIVPAYICEIPVTEIGYNMTRSNNGYLINETHYNLKESNKQLSIKTIVIPDTVEIIRSHAFEKTNNCTSLTLGNSLKQIEDGSLYYLSVTEITLPEGLEYAGDVCVESTTLKTINLPGEGNHLNLGYSFDDCTAVTQINNAEYIYCVSKYFCDGSPWMTDYMNKADDNSLVYLGKCAFNYKGTLPENLVIKSGTLSIGNYLFENYKATKFKTVTLPESLEVIGEEAFRNSNCSGNIESMNLPNSLKYIGFCAFGGCTSLVFDSFPSNENLKVKKYAFYRTSFKTCVVPEGADVNTGCLSSDTVVLPSNLKCIGYDTVEVAKTIYISEGTEKIYKNAFSDCSNLETIFIPNSVTFIDDSAFYRMSNNAVIYCKKGSCAETFAKTKGYKYKILDTVEAKTGVEIDYVNNEITATVYGATNILDLLCVDLSTVTYKPSLKTGNSEVFGTGSIIAIKTDNNNYVFTLVVKGDVNGDGVCDALDALQTENAINGNTELKSYQMSAITENDSVTVTDYQNVINQVVSQ